MYLSLLKKQNLATNLAGGGGEASPAKEKTSLERKNRPQNQASFLVIKRVQVFFFSSLDREVNRWVAYFAI
jgi:hypothetical protein